MTSTETCHYRGYDILPKRQWSRTFKWSVGIYPTHNDLPLLPQRPACGVAKLIGLADPLVADLGRGQAAVLQHVISRRSSLLISSPMAARPRQGSSPDHSCRFFLRCD